MGKREGYFVQTPSDYGDGEERKMPRIVDGGDVVAIARRELPSHIVDAIDEGAIIGDILADLDPALRTLARRYHSLRTHSSQDWTGHRVCIG